MVDSIALPVHGCYDSRDVKTILELVGFDLRPEIKKVSCPALVISGTYDRINPPAFGKEIAEELPDAEYTEIPGGHALSMEFEDEYICCVKTFLGK